MRLVSLATFSLLLFSSVALSQPAAPSPAKTASPAAPNALDAKPAKKPQAPAKPAQPDPSQAQPQPGQPPPSGQAPAQPPPAAAPQTPPAQTPPAQTAKPDDDDDEPPAKEPLMPKTAEQAPSSPTVAPDQDKDAKALAKQGSERPTGEAEIGAKPSDVYAEDWWSQARPVFEIHGYYRVRSELFHNFALGRFGDLWGQPSDNDYVDFKKAHGDGGLDVAHGQGLCGPDAAHGTPCEDNTQAGANMRFRLNPELHISDNLRVLSQIDLLDNVVLGSTPEGFANYGGQLVPRGGAASLGAFATTQWTPTAGYNSFSNSVSVKRVWGEYMTPVGMLRFGRMPSHWGLGMLANSGDGYDSDWQSTADRIMFVTGIKKYDLYFAGAWDFANEGATSARASEQQGQPYDLGQLDDVNQYVLVVVRRRNPELQKLELARGQFVVNGGLYFVYRSQFLANDGKDVTDTKDIALGNDRDKVQKGYVRRDAQAFIPDLWLQLLYRKFRFEAEAALITGSIHAIPGTQETDWKVRQFGLATQSEFRAIEDRLRIQFGFGYATGDPDVDSIATSPDGLQPQRTSDKTFSEFRFHPDYRVDLIFFRNILSRVEGAYYFRPSVDYDFARDKNGQRLGGGAAVIWSRASEFIQTPGHARDLGLELNFQLYFQSKDGTLNDDPDKMGGFFTSLQYGVLFPLSGLNFLPGETARYTAGTLDTKTAQTLRWYLGILF